MSGRPNAALRQRWRGYMPAVVTPFDARHRVDIAAFTQILDWLISEGVHGLAVAGTTGEWQALTHRERCLLFDVARRHVPSDRPAIAGCSALRIEESKRYLRAAADAGFDAALLTVPPYVCPTEDEAIHYFRIMADLAPLPLIVYNWPQGTGIDLSVSALRISASHGNVIGIKNSTPDRTVFRQALDLIAGETLMFGVMPGKAGIDLMRNTQAAGCIGAAGVLARSQAGFFDAAARGDWTRAEQLGRHDERLMATFFSGFRGRYAHAISTLKFLLHERGLPAGTVRMPLRSIDSALAQRLSRLIDETGLFTDA